MSESSPGPPAPPRLSDELRAAAHLLRARAYTAAEKADKAARDIRRALRLAPTWAAVYLERGRLLVPRKKYEDALVDFRLALALDRSLEQTHGREVAQAYSELGEAVWVKGDNDLALARFDEAIRLDPCGSGHYNSRALVFVTKDDYARALVDFDESLRLNPDHAGVHCNRGLALRHLGDLDRAIAAFSEAIRLDKVSAYAHAVRAEVCSERGQFTLARADYEQMTRFFPKQAKRHNNLAWFLVTVRDRAFRDGPRALAAATRACELTDWRDADYLDTLAAAHAACGDFAAAVRWQKEAARLAPARDRRKIHGRVAYYQAGWPP